MLGPLSYIGGKRVLAKRVIEMLPIHTTYVEPFAGGAQVFFHKVPSRVEVLNDLDSEIVNFLRVCQRHYEELLRCLRFSVVSRSIYELLHATAKSTLTDIEKAARFLYLQKNSFAGLVRKQNYASHVIQPPSFNPDRLPELIESTHRRLTRVQLECLPYEVVLARYDRQQTVFFLDPPYWGKCLYTHNFAEDDFKALERRLRSLTGQFILTLNDLPETRELFNDFHVQPVQLSYTSQKVAGRRYGELIITNFKP
ncbi:MAG: DNA adenine methylase [Candidatus Korobacteraceae bacterium]